MSRSIPLVRAAVAIVATVIAVSAAVWIHRAYGGPRSTLSVRVDPGVEPETVWDEKEYLVVDPVAGFRPRRSCTQTHPMAALDGVGPEDIVKRRDSHGFLRESELPLELSTPRVLVLGDSHVDGVVSTHDNFTSLLEERATKRDEPYFVLNAGCALYGLWQDVLRARDLLPTYRPEVVVVVVFLGNDFLDLENPFVPHLDDELRELPAGEKRSFESTSARQKALALPALFEQIFWQGLNQAFYLHSDPSRIDVLAQMAGHAIDVLETAARAYRSRVIWVLLPSFDLVFEDKVASLGGVVEETVKSGVQRRMRDAFMAELTRRSVRVVDLEPAFRTDGRLGLYAIDFHVFRSGHRLLADLLEAPIREALGAR